MKELTWVALLGEERVTVLVIVPIFIDIAMLPAEVSWVVRGSLASGILTTVEGALRRRCCVAGFQVQTSMSFVGHAAALL